MAIRDLTVYKKAFQLALEIFEISKTFPKEERYGLTDQIRRSSRTVAACIGEAYRKRQYEAYFVSKSSDADMENTETRVWLDFALAFKYIDEDRHAALEAKAVESGQALESHDRKSKKNTPAKKLAPNCQLPFCQLSTNSWHSVSLLHHHHARSL